VLTGGALTQTTAATYAVTADFVPTDTVNYNSLPGLAAGNFVIDRATPTINWSTPSDIVYGTALSSAQLNATATGVGGASVSGTFVYTPVAGTVLSAGNGQNLSVVFTSTNTNYNNAYRSVVINVTPKPLTITASSRAKLLGELVTFAGTEFAQNGLIGTDSIASVTLTSTGAPAAAPVGTYPIVPSSAVGAVGTVLTNYAITYANGTLTVGYNICALYNESLAHKKGSTIPVKLNLCDVGGNNVSSAAVVVKAAQISRIDGSASPFVAEDSGNANPDLDFRFAGDSYIYNLSTKAPGFVQGSWGITFTVNGVSSTGYVAKFDIK
jgi:hypothetical protein